MKKKSIQFLTLDALRGLAAIIVAIFHFSPWWGGYLAVDFFLVLSGFILSHSYLYKDNTTTVIDFIGHRLARLYPLHIFTLFTFIIASIFVNGSAPIYTDGTLFTFIQHLTLTQNIGFNPRGLTYNYPSWSISVEFWVNVLFILYISKATKNSTLFITALIGILIIYGNTGHLDTQSENYYSFINSGIIRGISSFFLGILSYRIYIYYRKNIYLIKYISYIEVLCVIVVSVIVIARSGKFSGLDVFAPFVFMFVVAVFTFETGFLSKRILKLKYLGEISYSIYLNQITVLITIKYLLSRFDLSKSSVLLVYLIVLIIYSHFTFQYIEKPLRKKGRNLLSKITATPR